MTTKMRPFGKTISLDEAQARIAAALRPIDRTETVRLAEASGRVLARDITAAFDVPPFARAAMDGYAVLAADTIGASRQTPRALRRVGTAFTGQVTERTIAEGECIEIATGAPLPPGADAVVIVEDTDGEASGAVQVYSTVKRGQNVGRQGADIQAGQLVLAAGAWLSPSRIGALAALGIAQIEVYGRPRVAVLSTGNEIVEPGQTLSPGQVFDINRFSVSAVVQDHGAIPVPFRIAQDTLEDLSRAVDACLQEDVLVFSGGSSVGERDLILDVLAARGEVIFHGIAVKPGKPTAFGLVDGKPFFGMPGYPTSCLFNSYILLAPALRTIARLPAAVSKTVAVPLAKSIRSVPDRLQFYTVRLVGGQAEPAFKASGDITSMSLADGYIEIPAGTEVVDQGTLVEVTLF